MKRDILTHAMDIMALRDVLRVARNGVIGVVLAGLLGYLTVQAFAAPAGDPPLLMIIEANDAACEMQDINSTGKLLGECRYTVENSRGVRYGRVEFRRKKTAF